MFCERLTAIFFLFPFLVFYRNLYCTYPLIYQTYWRNIFQYNHYFKNTRLDFKIHFCTFFKKWKISTPRLFSGICAYLGFGFSLLGGDLWISSSCFGFVWGFLNYLQPILKNTLKYRNIDQYRLITS